MERAARPAWDARWRRGAVRRRGRHRDDRRASPFVAGRSRRQRRVARGLLASAAPPSASRATAAPATRTRCSSAPGCSRSRCRRSCSTSTGSCPTRPQPWEGSRSPSLGWFIGWLVAGIAFVLARPWWDRRGRRRIPPRVVLRTAARARRPRRAAHRVPPLAPAREERGPASPAAAFAADVASRFGSSASWRSRCSAIAAVAGVASAGDVRSPHPWLAAAWLLATAGPDRRCSPTPSPTGRS